MKQENFLAYVKWEMIAPWKLQSLMHESPDVPIGYGSGQRAMQNVGKGAVLWVISMPTVKLPRQPALRYGPTLVARIRVREVLSRAGCPADLRTYARFGGLLKHWEYVATSDVKDSVFYELNDATDALRRLTQNGRPIIGKPSAEQVRAHGRPQALRVRIGQRCQSIRQVDAESIRGLEQIRQAAGCRTAFISYSHGDGRRFALDLEAALRPFGFSTWLDSLSLTPPFAAPDDQIAQLLLHGIERSQLLIALVTPGYAIRRPGFNWTLAEWNEVSRPGGERPCIQVALGGKKVSDDASLVPRGRSAKSLAKSIVEWWDRR